ncbi:hypothetical protein OG730_40450 [Streptomyces sp. NBC_01298]|uniref:hypothetical protein n=1 Tax=Streptomyces sp. NBC_01298 TaxID=2903817 RepID=UPI002E0D95E3|nr:hypothetical protein OG730_40450 [Streptomyces sp. NBC_01298]
MHGTNENNQVNEDIDDAHPAGGETSLATATAEGTGQEVADANAAVRGGAEGARAEGRALLTARRWGAARQAARTGLKAYGPDAELSLLLALAHAAEDDDDEDDRAEEVYRDALEVFPDHLGLLAGYAELCLRSDFQDRPARKNRGPALAARVAELAPDSPEALRVAQVQGAPWLTAVRDKAARPPRVARTQLYDLRQALAAGRGVRPAAGQARADAAQRPDDARRAMLAEALEVLDRPGRVLLLPLVRRPFESGLVRGVLLGAVLVAVVGLGLPQWVWWAGIAAYGALPFWLGRVLRGARRRGEPAAAAHPVPREAPLPELAPVPPYSSRELAFGLAGAAVVLSSLVVAGVWSYAKYTAYPRYEVVSPDSFQGMKRVWNSPLNQLLAEAAVAVPGDFKAFTEVYGDPTANEGHIGIYGITGDWHDMSPRMLTSFADAARAGAESVGATVRTWKPEAGPAGGWLECVEITAADGYRNITCLWGDKGSFGRVTIVDPDLADRADSLTRELRAALVHPAVGADTP